MKACLRLTFFACLLLPALAAAHEPPVHVPNSCPEGQPFTIKIPVRFPADTRVEYLWYRNDTAVTAAATLAAGESKILYTVPASKACGKPAAFHFAYRCADGCDEWTRSPRYLVTFLPPQISEIAGDQAVCANTVNAYSVASVPGVSYAWSLPAGWTKTAGGSTHSITVMAGTASGSISVTPSTACGKGAARTLAVSATTCGDIPCAPINTPGVVGVAHCRSVSGAGAVSVAACSDVGSAGAVSGVAACSGVSGAGAVSVAACSDVGSAGAVSGVAACSGIADAGTISIAR